jgi:hypothetical protein
MGFMRPHWWRGGSALATGRPRGSRNAAMAVREVRAAPRTIPPSLSGPVPLAGSPLPPPPMNVHHGFCEFTKKLCTVVRRSRLPVARFVAKFYLSDWHLPLPEGGGRPFPCPPPFSTSSLPPLPNGRRRRKEQLARAKSSLGNVFAGILSWYALGQPSRGWIAKRGDKTVAREHLGECSSAAISMYMDEVDVCSARRALSLALRADAQPSRLLSSRLVILEARIIPGRIWS